MDFDLVPNKPPPGVKIFDEEIEEIEESDDEDEDMEGIMAQLFSHLAPILQGVPGGHWDFILDVMENNLEVGFLFRETHVIFP